MRQWLTPHPWDAWGPPAPLDPPALDDPEKRRLVEELDEKIAKLRDRADEAWGRHEDLVEEAREAEKEAEELQSELEDLEDELKKLEGR